MLDFIFRYRINVICLAFVMCIAIFSQDIKYETMMISISFGMLLSFVYLFNKVTDLKEDFMNPKSLPINLNNLTITRNIAIALAMIPIPYLLFNHPKILVFYLLGPGLFGLLYSYPLKIIGFNKRLKDLPYTKNLVSAIILWASIPAILPLIYYNRDFSYQTFQKLIITSMSVLVIEIIWDIRDIEGDLAAGIKTIPNQFGITAAKMVCIVLFGITTFPSLFGNLWIKHSINPLYATKCLLTVFLILMIKKTSHAYTFQAIVVVWFFTSLIPLIHSFVG